MKLSAPDHIRKFCTQDFEDDTYCQLYRRYQDVHSFVYKIKCACGCNEFQVYMDDHPSIYVKCKNCDSNICIYDLVYYLVAVKLEENLELKPVCINDIHFFNVYAIYEYGAEFLEEENYDLNDISAGTAFIESNNILKIILADETA